MVVRETTVEAFSSLIRFIYDDPGCIPPTDDRQKLVEILGLAEKYEVKRLVEKVRKMLIKLPIKVEIGSENKSEFENAIKVENMSEDLVDYEMNMNVENMGEDISGYEYAMKFENPSDVNIKPENNSEDPLNIAKEENNFCNSIKIEKQVSTPETSTKKKSNQCRFCPKSFPWPSLLKRHERTHTGEMPFKCQYCHKKFDQKGNLTKHPHQEEIQPVSILPQGFSLSK